MAWLTNVSYRDRKVENERLELTDKGSLYFLGPNATFKNCNLVLNVSGRNLVFDQGTHFTDCTFEVKQELKNHQAWVFAALKGCRFKGRLWGVTLAIGPTTPSGQGTGSIEDCDFTEARLDACRFLGCDPTTLRFPRWPHFTFLDPIGHSRELNQVQWPELFSSVVIEKLHDDPPSTKALTYFAPAVAKRLDTTPEALKAVIEKFDCIFH